MHSLPQDRIGVPYVHDDCHMLYRPVKQTGVEGPSGSLQVGLLCITLTCWSLQASALVKT